MSFYELLLVVGAIVAILNFTVDFVIAYRSHK